MQGCRRSKLLASAMLASAMLVGAVLALSAIGCASSGRDSASKSGPSPAFGLTYVPQQSEPPVESVADGGKPIARKNAGRKSQSQAVVTADLDAPGADLAGAKGTTLANWLASREKPQPPRKPLPLSSSSPVASDDEQ